MLDLVGGPELLDSDVTAIQEVIVATGALDELEAHIAALTESAVAALDTIDIVPAAKAELALLADYVSFRQT